MQPDQKHQTESQCVQPICTVGSQGEKCQGRYDETRSQGKTPTGVKTSDNQFTKAPAILPDSSSYCRQGTSNTNIGKVAECTLHRVRDGVKGVLLLAEESDDQETGHKGHCLNDYLNGQKAS
jgi:hypothetical protein